MISLTVTPTSYCAATMTFGPPSLLGRKTKGAAQWRNLPPNCQAQDISKYRFALLRAIARNAGSPQPDDWMDESLGAVLPYTTFRIPVAAGNARNPRDASIASCVT